MATYGPTSAGWVNKPTETIDTEIDGDLKGILGDSAGTETDGSIPLKSFAGQQKSQLVDGFSAMWDLLQGAVSAFDPNQASGAQLDAACALTGTTREPQTFSTVTVTCTGKPLTTLNAGRTVKTTDTGSTFASEALATIAAVTAWAALTAYIAGDRRTNASRVYQCITGGTSAASGGPTTTAADITDGTVHWEYLGDGTAVVDVLFEAQVAGPVGALAGSLTQIGTPVDGWSGARNLLDAIPGALVETDPALRAKREAELAGQGGSTADAIRAHVLKVNDGSADPAHQPPTACTVFFNDTDFTDADGVPPHAVEVLAQGGTDQDIAQAVWEAVGAGTATVGNQTSTIVDSQGVSQTVKWSRPVSVPIYVTATVYYDPAAWPAGSDSIVAQAALSALLTYAATKVTIGLNQRLIPLGGAILRGPSQTDESSLAVVPADPGQPPFPGGLDVSPLYFGTSASPAGSIEIQITTRQIATFDSSRCIITATSEAP